VGGTSLQTVTPGGAWQSETTWNNGSATAGAGGGGISGSWPIPSYQSGVVSSQSLGSTTMRNVPDVSLNADPNEGYSIYLQGSWSVWGGTSAAAPLWAAFTALVNQERASTGRQPIGFLNLTVYKVAGGARYASDFHDIVDGSTNLYYPAVKGFDDATGWGTFIGSGLLADLTTASATSIGATLGNVGFENGSSKPAPWSASPGVIDNSASEPPHSGEWKAWLCGYGRTHSDTLAQWVALPSTATSITLTFWLHIDTAETTKTKANDPLTVTLCDVLGRTITTLATYSNLNACTGYVQRSFDLTAYKGMTVMLDLTGMENNSLQTSFVVDDFALNVL
jgi:kumamolisin